jgi:CheY-like chemotaxis protein
MTATPSGSSALRIFVIEDHRDSLQALQIYLEYAGHFVRCAGSKAEALKEIPAANCDILISNISLPDGTGWELIREMGTSRPAYAIAMSGHGTKADSERSADAGFRHHLTKPVSPERLSTILAEAFTELKSRK